MYEYQALARMRLRGRSHMVLAILAVPAIHNRFRSSVATADFGLSECRHREGIDSLRSINSILESAASSLIAPHIAHEISKYLG